jgi:rare lipoprotein A
MRKHKLTLLVFLTSAATILAQNNIYANPSQIVYLRPDEVVRTGMASWYSRQSPGINTHTANNEIFDDTDLTAAMWDVPFDQLVKVTNLENGSSVVVRVNDRGPHKRFVEGERRIIDLSKQAFSTIASLDKGLIRIQLELL